MIVHGENIMTEQQECSIQEFVKGRLLKADIAHGFDHVQYVVGMSKKLAVIEGADLDIVIPSAYLHDVVSRKEVQSFDDHTKVSASVAEGFLVEIGFTIDEVQKISRVIIESSYESYLRGIEPSSIEAKVVRDADWLDAMGARGIARVFAFAGHYGCPEMGKVNWDPEDPEKLPMNTLGPDPSPIYHFFSKLLWLKDLMLTSAGKQEAQKRHQFMVEFLRRYREECVTDP